MEDALQPPSVVKFINDNAKSIWRDMTGVAEESLAQLKSRLHRRGLDNDPPVLRAVRKDGEWWALDNRALYVCQDLERQGKCPRVRIEAVHLNDVPAEVWEGKEFPAKNKILRRRLNGNENCTACKEGYKSVWRWGREVNRNRSRATPEARCDESQSDDSAVGPVIDMRRTAD
ncbi:hypothetical protein Bbelb_273470 [Branchiostoma belcheri]|nr:hypothetical protein Bbelb_273470 [Branchiostoma belcheri]